MTKSSLFPVGRFPITILGFALVVAMFLSACHAPLGLYALDPRDETTTGELTRLEAEGQKTPTSENLDRLGWARWFLKNDGAGASEAFGTAIQKSPCHVSSWMGLALIQYYHGNLQASEKSFAELLKCGAGTPYAEVALSHLDGMYDQTSSFIEVTEPVLLNVADQPGVDYRSRLRAYVLLGQIAREKNDRSGEARWESRQGFNRKWLMFGPFGYFGMTDFDHEYGPEKSSRLLEEYRHDDLVIQPVPMDTREDESLIGRMIERGGVYYFAVIVKTKTKVEGVVRLSTKELSNLYIDGNLVLSVDPRKRHEIKTHDAAITLSEGSHTVVIKIGAVDSVMDFDFQIIGRNGMPLNLDYSNLLTELPARGNGAEIQDLPDTALRYWHQRAMEQPDLYNLMMASFCWNDLQDYMTSRRLLDEAIRLNPHFALLYMLRGFGFNGDPTIPASKAQDMSRKDMLATLELDPLQTFATLLLVIDDFKKGDIEKATLRLDQIVQQQEGFYLAHDIAYLIYQSRGWKKEAEASINKALAINYRNISLLKEAQAFYESQNRFGEAETILKRIDALDGPGLSKAFWLQEKQMWPESIAAFKESLAWEPYKDFVWAALAGVYRQSGDYASAIQIYQQLQNKSLGLAGYAMTLAELYQLQGDPAKSREVMKQELDRHPSNFTVRRALAFSEGTEILGEQVTNGLDVIRQYLEKPWKEDAGSVFILDEYIAEILPDGGSMKRTHTITRVQTKDALSEYGELRIPPDAEIYQARLVKSDGRILLPESIDGKSSLSLPEIEVGDFVESDYVEFESPSRGLLDGRLIRTQFYFRNINLPTYRSHFVLLHPKQMEVRITEVNYSLAKPLVVDEKDRKIVRYRNEQIEPIIPESNMPPMEEISAYVKITRPVKWTEIRDIYRQAILEKKTPSKAMWEFIDKNTKPLDSDCQKVKSLFNAVLEIDGDDQNFSLNQSASMILEVREGNRLLLLSTLLDMLKIDNHFVLARRTNLQEPPEDDASFTYFTQPYLVVNLCHGGQAVLDASYKESAFNEIDPLYIGAKALVLDEGDPFITLKPDGKDPNDVTKEQTMSLMVFPDGSAKFRTREVLTGHGSVILRRSLKLVAPEELKTGMEKYVNTLVAGSTLETYDFKGLDKPDAPLTMVYSFATPQIGLINDGVLRIKSTYLPYSLTTAMVQTAERRWPLMMNRSVHTTTKMIFDLPQGIEIERLPSSKRIITRFGVYTMSVSTRGKVVTIKRTLHVPSGRIDPSEYAEFGQFCKKVDEAEKEEMVLRIPTSR